MQRNLRGYVLGSFLISAMGFAACSSDDDDDITGTGGSETGGVAGATTKATAKGGGGPTGGTTAKTGTGGSAPTSSAQGGSAPASSAQGGSSHSSSSVAAGAPGAGAPGSGGASTAAGGATGGTTSAAAGHAGVGQAGEAGAPTAGAAGASNVATLHEWTFESGLEDWAITDKWTGSIVIDGTDGVTLTQSGGAATWTVPFTVDWDGTGTMPPTQEAYIHQPATSLDLAGKTVTLRVRWVSGGTGTTAGVTTAFAFYAAFNDSDGTFKNFLLGSLASWASDMGAGYKDLTVTLPTTETNDFDPSHVASFSISVTASLWTDTPQPTFDYATAVFAIDSIAYQ